MVLTTKLFAEMSSHACEGVEREICGLIYNSTYLRLRNASSLCGRYNAYPQDLAMSLNRFGEPEAIFHTHPGGSLDPSELDLGTWYYTFSIMIIGGMAKGALVLRGYRKQGGRVAHEPLRIRN